MRGYVLWISGALLVAAPGCSSDSETGSGGGGPGTTSSSAADSSASSSASTGGTGATGTGGAGGNAGGTGGVGTGGMAAFALTSTGFTEGTAIPDKYACSGQNVSPDLGWTPGPAGTLSYAVLLTDKSNSLIHWAIWDIPGAVTSLPEQVENAANPATPAGAKQAKSYDNKTFGYLGPCPNNTHTYQFDVYALDVATLPNVTTASTRDEVAAEVLNHDLATASLSGTFTP